MILLTGAAGKTGQAIIHALKKHNEKIRALVRTPEQAACLSSIGGVESIIGDLRDKTALQKASNGCKTIYYICPNITPDEVQIGMDLLDVVRKVKLERIIYHSVLHPQIESMPHHWQKMRFEECLFESGINFTILQPCAYMQNLLSNWNEIVEKGIYSIPYATSSRLSIVDLEDIAEAASTVIRGKTHANAIYELAGPQALSQDEIASILSEILDIKVTAKSIERSVWAENARKTRLSETQIDTLIRMFEYYEKSGLVGNSNILEHLLGRPATTFRDFVKRLIPQTQEIISGGNR
jgi:NAD(P)H dehydrogenase (quinone)